MVETYGIWVYIAVAVVAANLPWLSEQFFFVLTPAHGKRAWMRLLEWLVLYFIVGGIGFGLEMKINGDIHRQHWVFYVVTVCLFLVFALPGFIYRYDLKKHLDKR